MGQMKASPRIDTASFSSYANPRDHDGLMRVGHVGEGRAAGVDTAFAVVMSAIGQRSFLTAYKADVVLETSGSQMPMGLGSSQYEPLFASSFWSLSSN